MRFRSQQSPRSDATTMNSLVSPPRNRLSQTFQQPAPDPRSNLSRRFTTDSGRVPTLSSNMAPRGPEQEYQVRGYCRWSVCVLRCRRAFPAKLDARARPSRRHRHFSKYLPCLVYLLSSVAILLTTLKAGYATVAIGALLSQTLLCHDCRRPPKCAKARATHISLAVEYHHVWRADDADTLLDREEAAGV